MINSRSLRDLAPVVRARAYAFLEACAKDEFLAAKAITVIVTSTYRDAEAQDMLYAQGRTTPGATVTDAKAGQSLHNWRCALDVAPLRAGKPVWGTRGDDGAIWHRIGVVGESCGLEWAGRWTRRREFPHFQYTGGKTLAQLQAGETIA